MNTKQRNDFNISLSFLLPMLLLAILFGSFITMGCDPPFYFDVENQTDEELLVYWGSSRIGTVPPGKVVEMEAVLVSLRYRITIMNKQKEVIYSENFTSLGLAEKKLVVTPHGTIVERR